MKTKILRVAFGIGCLSLFASGCSTEKHDADSHIHAVSSAKGYPLTKCVVTGEPLGDKPYTFVRNNQEVKLCCKDCLADFGKDPEKYMAKLNVAK